jgi:hypothetical protein
MIYAPKAAAMTTSIRHSSVVIAVLLSLTIAASALGRPDRPGPGARLATTVIGSAWTARYEPIAGARVQLRNAMTGRVETLAIANEAGQFTFENVEGSTYVVELLDGAGRVQVVGQVFTIAPGETVATFVRLTNGVPRFAAFFSNTVGAVSAAAAAGGITALAPVARPVSGKQ